MLDELSVHASAPIYNFLAPRQVFATTVYLPTVGGLTVRSRTLQILSATFTSFACGDDCVACSIWSRFRSLFFRDLSSVNSRTRSATSCPKRASSSKNVVSVSSTVSWRMAQNKVASSATSPSTAKRVATAIGWLMYGVALASLRRCRRCLSATNAIASKLCSIHFRSSDHD